jgi:hypothetical protein
MSGRGELVRVWRSLPRGEHRLRYASYHIHRRRAAPAAPRRGPAARLKANPKVAEHLAELQSEIAEKTVTTVEGLIAELEQARVRASSLNQLSAATAAILGKAKISGLMAPAKLEIGAPGSFNECTTPEQVVDELLTYELHPCIEVHERDRRTLVEMFLKHFAEVEEFIAGLKARPISSEHAYSQRRIELRRFGNGKARH